MYAAFSWIISILFQIISMIYLSHIFISIFIEGVPVPLPPGLLPAHKAAIVLFLERVYGIPDRNIFFKLLEDGFLPDLRAATTLDEVN